MAWVQDKTNKDVIMLETLLKMFKRGDFRNDYPLQRNPESWTNEYRDGLIGSVLKQEDLDPIKMCEEVTESGVNVWLIDGGNRLSSLNSFRNNEFRLGRKVEKPIVTYREPCVDNDGNFVVDENGYRVYDVVDYDIRRKKYEDLPQELKDVFNSFGIEFVKQLNCKNDDIDYHIRRYNHQSGMNSPEKSVTYMGKEVASYIKKIAEESRFFKDYGCYTEKEKSRGRLKSVIGMSIMASYHLSDWKAKWESMAVYLRDNATKEDFYRFEKNLLRLENIVDEKTNHLFNLKDSHIWFAIFENFTNLGLPDEKFKEFLYAFVDELHTKEVEGDSWDMLEEIRDTRSRKNVFLKIDTLTTIMEDYFHIDADVEDDEDIDILEFIQENVDPNADEEDISIYEEAFDDYIVEVDNRSPLLDEKNRPSWIALVADAFQNDLDSSLGKWMIQFFKTNTEFLYDQKDNFLKMKDSFHEFCATPA